MRLALDPDTVIMTFRMEGVSGRLLMVDVVYTVGVEVMPSNVRMLHLTTHCECL